MAHTYLRGLAAALLLGTAIVAGNPGAIAADRQHAAARDERRSPVERVETRIKTLHDKLHITQAQQRQFDAFAQVMRDNAQSMETAINQRRAAVEGHMSAVEELRAYQNVTETHAQALQKLVPAFQSLYDSLSDEQKKTADVLFSHPGRGHGARHASRKG